MRKDSSGPAFPSRIQNNGDDPINGFVQEDIPAGSTSNYAGMSLRDYFATKAMQALISNESAVQRHKEVAAVEGFNPEVLLATGAYMFADAMLAERAK